MRRVDPAVPASTLYPPDHLWLDVPRFLLLLLLLLVVRGGRDEECAHEAVHAPLHPRHLRLPVARLGPSVLPTTRAQLALAHVGFLGGIVYCLTRNLTGGVVRSRMGLGQATSLIGLVFFNVFFPFGEFHIIYDVHTFKGRGLKKYPQHFVGSEIIFLPAAKPRRSMDHNLVVGGGGGVVVLYFFSWENFVF